MEDALQRENVSEHGQDPGNGVEVGDEANAVEVVEQLWKRDNQMGVVTDQNRVRGTITWIVERLNVAELGEVLLNDGGVVLPEHAVQVLGYEGAEAGEGQALVVEVEVEEGRAQRVQPLPVDVLRVGRHPRLQHALELAVTLGGREQVVVLRGENNTFIKLL